MNKTYLKLCFGVVLLDVVNVLISANAIIEVIYYLDYSNEGLMKVMREMEYLKVTKLKISF